MLVQLNLCVYACTYICTYTHDCTCLSSDIECLPHLKHSSLLFLVFKMPLPWDHDIIAWHPMNFLQSAFMSSYARQNYELPSLLISGIKYHLHVGLSCWRQCGWWWVPLSSSPKAGKIIHSHLLWNRLFIDNDFSVTQSYCVCLTLLLVVILKAK